MFKFRIGIIMINDREFLMIHELYKRGHSVRSIAKLLNIDRKTVAKRLKEVALLPTTRNNKQSKLEPYKAYITERISKKWINASHQMCFCEKLKKRVILVSYVYYKSF